jgi:gluconokinase
MIMGVTGSGKTTIGEMLAARAGFEFVDADSFHSAANIRKMSQGTPLTDADREPWLRSIHEAVQDWLAEQRNVVLACSALRKSYREQICGGPEVKIVYLKGSFDFIAARLRERHGHFATESILAGQFADLEEPGDDAITVNIAEPPDEIVAEIEKKLGLR